MSPESKLLKGVLMTFTTYFTWGSFKHNRFRIWLMWIKTNKWKRKWIMFNTNLPSTMLICFNCIVTFAENWYLVKHFPSSTLCVPLWNIYYTLWHMLSPDVCYHMQTAHAFSFSLLLIRIKPARHLIWLRVMLNIGDVPLIMKRFSTKQCQTESRALGQQLEAHVFVLEGKNRIDLCMWIFLHLQCDGLIACAACLSAMFWI